MGKTRTPTITTIVGDHVTKRLESYDLSVDQWLEHIKGSQMNLAYIALSAMPGTRIGSWVVEGLDGSVIFRTMSEGDAYAEEYYTAAEAMVAHEKLARVIVERIEIMLEQPVAALSEGAL
jgi:hypothetical protein